MQNRVFLIKHGVPWEIAMDFEPYEVLGFCILIGQAEGNTFDWATMRWRQPRFD